MRSTSAIVRCHEHVSIAEPLLSYLERRRASGHLVEIVVVDDGSRDLTSERLRARGGDLTVLTKPTAEGIAAAWNDGAAAARGDDLFLLADELLPVGDPLGALRAHADRHQAAVVGAKIVGATDRVIRAGVVIGQDGRPHGLYAGFPSLHPAVNRSRRVQAVALGGALVGRERFLAGGGLGAELALDWEELDFCRRVAAGGGEIHVCHSARWWSPFAAPWPFTDESTTGWRGYERRNGKALAQDDLQHYLDDGLLTVKSAAPHPIRLDVSSMLATVDRAAVAREGDALLVESARMLGHLERENEELRAAVARRAASEGT